MLEVLGRIFKGFLVGPEGIIVGTTVGTTGVIVELGGIFKIVTEEGRVVGTDGMATAEESKGKTVETDGMEEDSGSLAVESKGTGIAGGRTAGV